MHNITLIKGDGIGPEISDAVINILNAADVQINWDIQNAGEDVIEKENDPLPKRVIESIKKNKIALKAPVTTPIGKGFRSVNVRLRKELDLYANIRPCKNIEGIKTPFKNVDLVVIRENTEDIYAGIEEKVTDDEMHSIKIITRSASTRIARYAFEYAEKYGRKTVWAVSKANICKLTDGLFLECARKVSEKYPDTEYKEILVDALCMQLVQNPSKFDVLVMPNLYGDIVSDLAAGLIGGSGIAQGANIGLDYAVFEPVHGSAPDIKGKNLANPSAFLLCAIQMLKYINEFEKAEKIEKAFLKTIKEGKVLTRDLGGNSTTTDFQDEIIRNL